MNYDLVNKQKLTMAGTGEGTAYLAEEIAGSKAKVINKNKSEVQ